VPRRAPPPPFPPSSAIFHRHCPGQCRTPPRRALAVLVLAVLVPAILAPAPASAQSAVHYVALGDSYSSGLGAGSYISSSGSCDQSTKGLPRPLERREPARLVRVRDLLRARPPPQ